MSALLDRLHSKFSEEEITKFIAQWWDSFRIKLLQGAPIELEHEVQSFTNGTDLLTLLLCHKVWEVINFSDNLESAMDIIVDRFNNVLPKTTQEDIKLILSKFKEIAEDSSERAEEQKEAEKKRPKEYLARQISKILYNRFEKEMEN